MRPRSGAHDSCTCRLSGLVHCDTNTLDGQFLATFELFASASVSLHKTHFARLHRILGQRMLSWNKFEIVSLETYRKNILTSVEQENVRRNSCSVTLYRQSRHQPSSLAMQVNRNRQKNMNTNNNKCFSA